MTYTLAQLRGYTAAAVRHERQRRADLEASVAFAIRMGMFADQVTWMKFLQQEVR